MKICFISDTHTKHKEIPDIYFEDVDLLIHSGDISSRGYRTEIVQFLDWFESLPIKHKVFISGNHDFYFEQAISDIIIEEDLKDLLDSRPSIIYLNDSGVEIEGVKIWGSPVQPYFHGWAFNRVGSDIKKHWDLIPDETEILITHGPIQGYLDMTLEGVITGCPYLKETIDERLKHLKIHACGHIHEAYGRLVMSNGQVLLNASLLNRRYEMQNRPITMEWFDSDSIDYGIISMGVNK